MIPALLLLLVCESAGGILGFPQLVYSLRYSQGKRQGRRLPCLHPSLIYLYNFVYTAAVYVIYQYNYP